MGPIALRKFSFLNENSCFSKKKKKKKGLRLLLLLKFLHWVHVRNIYPFSPSLKNKSRQSITKIHFGNQWVYWVIAYMVPLHRCGAPTPVGYTWKVFTEQGWGLTCSQGDRSTSHFLNSHSLVQSLQTSCQDILLGLPGFLGPDSEYNYSFVFLFLLGADKSLSMHLNSLNKCFELLCSFPKAPLPAVWLPPCDRPPVSPE